jgi:nucleoside-diphosphate-sugar epimerase
VVDVRDLAVAHRLAMETAHAAGNRYICAGDHVWMRDMAQILAAAYGPRGFRVATHPLPDPLVRLAALFDRGLRLTVPALGKVERVSAARARRDLGWTMRPVDDTVRDTAESLLRTGVVPSPGRAGSGPSARPVPAAGV